MTEKRKVKEIIVGERLRKPVDPNEPWFRSFAERAERLGRFLHPVVVYADGRLACGYVRLEVAKYLGWEEVDVVVVPDALDPVEAQVIEQRDRRPLSPLELYPTAKRFLDEEAAKAAGRRGLGGSASEGEKGKARDRAARRMPERISGPTLLKLVELGDTGMLTEPEERWRRAGNPKYDRTYNRLKRDRARAEATKNLAPFVPDRAGEPLAALDSILLDDCLDVMRRIGEPFAHAIWMDPPYWVGLKYGDFQEGKNDPEGYWRWLRPFFEEAWRLLLPGGFMAVCQSDQYQQHWREWFGEYRVFAFGKRQTDRFIGTNGFSFTWEPVLFVRKPGPQLWPDAHHSHKMHFESEMRFDVFAKGTHPCPKPMDLCLYILDHFVMPGGVVLEPFGGLCAFSIAAKFRGRRFLAVERHKPYWEIANQRLRVLEPPDECKYEAVKAFHPLRGRIKEAKTFLSPGAMMNMQRLLTQALRF